VTRQETIYTRTIRRNERLQTKKRKNNMSTWSVTLGVKAASKLVSWFSPTRCSGQRHCFNVAAWKFCCKKRFSRRVLAKIARSLPTISLETLRFLAPELMVSQIWSSG